MNEDGVVAVTRRTAIRLLLLGGLVAGAGGQEAPRHTFGTTVVSTSGLQGHIYNLKPGTKSLPRFRPKKAVGTIYTQTLNIWPQRFDEGFPGITDRNEWFAIDYRGEFWIERPGEYRFSLLSDDGSRLSIDGVDLINNDGHHMPQAVGGAARLSRGVHEMRVSYFQGPRFTVALVLAVAPPGGDWRIFDFDDFLPPEDESEWVRGGLTNVRPNDSQ